MLYQGTLSRTRHDAKSPDGGNGCAADEQKLSPGGYAGGVAMLRLDDLYVDSFLVTDVKMLAGDHLSRAIGRVTGQDGKTKYAIENATRTRIVVADQKIHIMGAFSNIKMARDAICNLIIGAPPGKVYNQMRNVAKRMNERF